MGQNVTLNVLKTVFKHVVVFYYEMTVRNVKHSTFKYILFDLML